ncbi:MAG: hypothetical protein P4L22_05510 [Candidatus Babeliales bacterium]|nr:hypothetical protein [Candidatus Babeliales bacterium]
MKFIKLIVFAISLFLANNFSELSGIAHYKSIPLDYITTKNLDDESNKENSISFEYKIFNKYDCKKYLGREAVIKNGYCPIQIKLTNNSNRYLRFSLADFSFPCVAYHEVADKVEFSTAKRLVGWGIGTLFIPFLIIPFIIEAVESPKANHRLEEDFARKALTDQVLRPNDSVNGVIFVAKQHFTPSFSFTLSDEKNGNKYKLSTTNNTLDIKSSTKKSNSKPIEEEEKDEDSEIEKNFEPSYSRRIILVK